MSKKNFKNPADEFLSVKSQTTKTKENNKLDNEDSNSLSNGYSNGLSNRNSIRISDIFDNIKEDRNDGATRSFYLSNRIYNILVKKAKDKKISNSKFLEGILNQLFFEE